MAMALDEFRRFSHLVRNVYTTNREGAVRIVFKDGLVFVIRPELRSDPTLDVEGIRLNIATAEVVRIVREGREARI